MEVLLEIFLSAAIAAALTFAARVLCCLAFDDDGWIESGE